jgi:RNA polymerase sigma factor for flagellar operon FliA
MSEPAGQMRPPLTRAQQILVAEHRYMVLLIAGALMAAKRFCPLSHDELVALGNMGLVEAAQVYDPAREVAFEGFAWKRIHGAMMNGIRREKAIVTAARKALYRCMGVQTGEENIMTDTAEDDQARLESIRDAMAASLFLGAAASILEGCARGSESAAELREEYAEGLAALAGALSTLPDLERRLIQLHYYEGRKLHEVAPLLPLPDSSTRRLHAGVLDRLAQRLRARGVTSAPALEGRPP